MISKNASFLFCKLKKSLSLNVAGTQHFSTSPNFVRWYLDPVIVECQGVQCVENSVMLPTQPVKYSRTWTQFSTYTPGTPESHHNYMTWYFCSLGKSYITPHINCIRGEPSKNENTEHCKKSTFGSLRKPHKYVDAPSLSTVTIYLNSLKT